MLKSHTFYTLPLKYRERLRLTAKTIGHIGRRPLLLKDLLAARLDEIGYIKSQALEIQDRSIAAKSVSKCSNCTATTMGCGCMLSDYEGKGAPFDEQKTLNPS